jgi:hypothetical protein
MLLFRMHALNVPIQVCVAAAPHGTQLTFMHPLKQMDGPYVTIDIII